MEFQTLPAADPHRPARLHLGQKAIHHRRLANPRLAREPHDLPRALLGPREGRMQAGQFLRAADEVGCRGWRVGGGGGSRVLPGVVRRGAAGCRRRPHRANEPITLSADRLEKLWGAGGIL
jgi:hypothetical protein